MKRTIDGIEAIRMISAVLLATSFVFLLGCSRNSPYDRHFDRPLPQGSRLLHYKARHSGPDASYAFVFAVSDDALRDRLIIDWRLTIAYKPISFVALDAPSWWPTDGERDKMEEQYQWLDEEDEEFKSVWIDTKTNLLYAEYGSW